MFLTCILIKQGKHMTILFLNWSSCSMVATLSFSSLSPLLHTSKLKWHWHQKFPVLCHTNLLSISAFNRLNACYLWIALATHFTSSLVLGGLNLHSAICFAKQHVCSELTISKVTTWNCWIFKNCQRAAIKW